MPFTVDHGPLNKRAMVKTDDIISINYSHCLALARADASSGNIFIVQH